MSCFGFGGTTVWCGVDLVLSCRLVCGFSFRGYVYFGLGVVLDLCVDAFFG